MTHLSTPLLRFLSSILLQVKTLLMLCLINENKVKETKKTPTLTSFLSVFAQAKKKNRK